MQRVSTNRCNGAEAVVQQMNVNNTSMVEHKCPSEQGTVEFLVYQK